MNTQVLNTYSYYDYGMVPAYLASFDAPNREDAARQAAESGLQMHRVTPVLGVRILVSDIHHARGGDSTYLTPRFATRAEAFEHLRKEPPPPMVDPQYAYVYPSSWNEQYNPRTAVTRPIEDIEAEREKYLPHADVTA